MIVPWLSHSVPPVTIKAFLGLLLLSVLLTPGYSLACEKCVAQAATCTGEMVACPAGHDSCLSILTERTVGSSKVSSIMKSCFPKGDCEIILKHNSSGGFGDVKSLIKSIECSRAPVSTGSLFLALSSLLFLKLLW